MKGIMRKMDRGNSAPGGGRPKRSDLHSAYSAMELNLLIAQGMEVEEMGRLVVTAMPSLLGVPFAALGFWERDAEWRVVGQWNERPLEATVAQELSSLLAKTLAEQAFTNTGSLLLADCPSAAGAVPEILAKLGVRSLLVAPVRTTTNSFGVMLIGREVAQDYTTSQRLLVGSVANQMAAALENSRLYEASQREVAERKQAEEALRKSESFVSAIFDSITDLITVQDTEYNIITTNRIVEQVFGKGVVGEKCYQAYQGRDSVCPDCPTIRVLATGEPTYSAEQVCRAGRIVETWAFPIKDEHGNIIAVIDYGRDITERKRMEEKIMKEKEFTSSLLKGLKDGFAVVDQEGKQILVNDELCKMTGYSEKELLDQKPPFKYWAEEGLKDINEALERTLKGIEGEYELIFKKKNGERFVALVSPRTTVDSDGNTIFFATISDITKRKQAEEALRKSEEKYRGLVSNVKLGIFRSTPEPLGRFLEVNPAMEKITGYRRKELLQMNVADLYVHPEERGAVLEEVALGKGKAAKEVRLRRKDGTEIVVLDRKVAMRDDAGQIIYFDGILEDITERKQAEEREKELQRELSLSRRLASIGELAAGVAHEINNPLTGIIGFSQRLLRKGNDEKIKRDLERIHSEAQRAAKVVENLMTFARRREPKKEYSDINEILARTLELRAYELKTSNIELIVELASGLPKTMVDFQQMQQVFLNIIINAEQAMGEANRGGKLTIKTQREEGRIRISFADDGPGIPAEHLDKLFDPFFTTRGERGGTGLGLSVCHGIVTEHGGKIYAETTLGKGTTFFVELPLLTKETDKSKGTEKEPVRTG